MSLSNPKAFLFQITTYKTFLVSYVIIHSGLLGPFLLRKNTLKFNNTYSSLFYHIVWSTKDRVPSIDFEIKEKLFSYISKLILNKELHPVAVGGFVDHVHILIQATPKHSISEIVCYLKSNSSRFMRVKFNPKFTWQGGYSVFTVDVKTTSRVKNYIKRQEQHHTNRSFEKEFSLLLKRYNT